MLSAIFVDSATSQQNAPHVRRVELQVKSKEALSDGRRGSVGEYDWPASLDHRRILRGHYIHAKIQLARRDADYGNQ
jgi:hypothetical protein